MFNMFNQPTWWISENLLNEHLLNLLSCWSRLLDCGWKQFSLALKWVFRSHQDEDPVCCEGLSYFGIPPQPRWFVSYNLPAIVIDHLTDLHNCQRDTWDFHFSSLLQDSAYIMPIFSVLEVTLHQAAEATTMLDPTAVAASWSRRPLPLLPLLPGSQIPRTGNHWNILERLET